MRRSPRVLLAWAAAVVVMLVTARVVAGDLGALQRRAHSLGADVTVVLAARDLVLGRTLTAGDVYTVKRPSTTISSDALHDPAVAVGRVVAVALLHDDVVGARHLAPGADGRGGAGINAVVPAGRRAVHVLIKDGFQPPPGAVVDVLATYDPASTDVAGPAGQASVVARGAQVLALAGTTPAATGGDTSGSDETAGAGVTLLVTEAEARAVAFAASIGVVALALAPAAQACCDGP
jgi:Flp pilus assembly protein CpaB